MHYQDKVNTVSRQTLSAAVILNSKGHLCGKIIVRFTDARIGYSHEVGVVMDKLNMDYDDNKKGGVYDTPKTLISMIAAAGGKPMAHGKIINKAHFDVFSRFDEIDGIKVGRNKFKILWAL